MAIRYPVRLVRIFVLLVVNKEYATERAADCPS
jgi:hypothetical protein